MWNDCNCMVIWTLFGIHYDEMRLLRKRLSCAWFEYKQYTQRLQYLQSGLLWAAGPLTEGIFSQKLSSWNLTSAAAFLEQPEGMEKSRKERIKLLSLKMESLQVKLSRIHNLGLNFKSQTLASRSHSHLSTMWPGIFLNTLWNISAYIIWIVIEEFISL